MKRVGAWMLTVGVLFGLLAGCVQNSEAPVTDAPPEAVAPPPYPPEQIPDPEETPRVTSAPPTAAPPPVDTSATATNRPAGRTAQPLPKESYPPVQANAPRTYVVRKGDTLQRISNQHYGTTKKWRAIYEANRKTLSNPDHLQIGMKLQIP